MRFQYDDVSDYTDIYASVNDVCVLCRHFDVCPLMEAIGSNLVYPSADKLTIAECPMFEMETIEESEN